MMERRQDSSSGTSRRRGRLLLAAAGAAALGSLFGPPPAAAGVNVWTPLGLNGGGVVAVLADPADARVAYAATHSAGVFKSSDGGASWQEASRGLTEPVMVALAAAPSMPGTLYAATSHSVFVSHDGAATWAPAAPFAPGLLTALQSLAADPVRAGTVYAATASEVWVSHDGGGSWTVAIDGRAVEIIRLAADPFRSSVFAFAGIQGDAAYNLFESADGGVTWNDLSASLPFINGSAVSIGFAIEPAAPGTLYLATTRRRIDTGKLIPKTYRSTDGGATWLGAGTGGVPVAAAAGGLVVAGGLRSADHGATWSSIAVPPDTVAGYAIAADGSRIYAAGAALGVLVSADHARSWQVASQGLAAAPVLAFTVDPRSPASLYAAVAGLGIFKSRNAGSRWRPLATGFPAPSPFARVLLAADPAASGTVYYFDGFTASFAKTIDAGASWTLPAAEGTCLDLQSTSFDPSSAEVLYGTGFLYGSGYVGCTGNTCQTFRSADGGATWSCLGIRAYEVAVAPAAPATLYALALVSSRGDHVLYRSTDAGTTWAPIDATLPPARQLAGAAGHLAVDPADAARLYVSGPSGIWMSRDGGAHWSQQSRGLPHGSIAPRLAIDPHDPHLLYAASGAIGVYRSRDGGGSWQPILAGLPHLSTDYTALVADPGRPGSVYLATADHGILTYSSP